VRCVSHPWEKGQGVGGRVEGDEIYERFTLYLRLGPSRNFGKLAKILDVTRQAIQKQAANFNWQERAEAFDAAKAAGVDVAGLFDESDPLPFPANRLPPPPKPPKAKKPKPPKPRKRRESRASQAQQAATQAVIEAQVLMPVMTSEQLQEQLDHLKEYRQLFETRSKKLLRQADDASDVVDKSYAVLQDYWDKWIWAVNKIFEMANSETTTEERNAAISYANFFAIQTKDATFCYKSYGEEQRKNLSEARLHLGDCVGLQDVLSQHIAQKAIK
jgi:hypothetical protein